MPLHQHVLIDGLVHVQLREVMLGMPFFAPEPPRASRLARPPGRLTDEQRRDYSEACAHALVRKMELTRALEKQALDEGRWSAHCALGSSLADMTLPPTAWMPMALLRDWLLMHTAREHHPMIRGYAWPPLAFDTPEVPEYDTYPKTKRYQDQSDQITLIDLY